MKKQELVIERRVLKGSNSQAQLENTDKDSVDLAVKNVDLGGTSAPMQMSFGNFDKK